jgi:hypothetical protein
VQEKPNTVRETTQRDVEPSFPDRYAKIPANGQFCEYSGLGHSRLYQLLNGPAKNFVRVASLREPGAKRGTRLFHVGDLLRFLNRLAEEQRGESSNTINP